ncbi:MAG: septum formation initiator family protein [Flavobacteriales bacterium]|uniref:FtsB family cell division protein n=1 Tax=Candidatus Ulvibacter alkanivorans TaxID=2267620 RepID=UPI000DF36E6E|nr:septum formation initiator family protein [Candidatus Ulvibacter alkanivorans]MCH2488694.1 septum formation initiator family protein [Flavobacteriales bacterium]
MSFSEIKQKKWFKVISNKYILILLLFVIWMFFFDTNSYFIHKELDDDIEALEENKAFYKGEIEKDKVFIEKMKDSNEVEKFAREKYYLKKENEDIYIIQHEDSIKKDNDNE